MLCSLADADGEVLPWHETQPTAWVNQDQAAETQLDPKPVSAEESDDQDGGDVEGMSELDDTFHFKRFDG
jgi:hypothetical protein